MPDNVAGLTSGAVITCPCISNTVVSPRPDGVREPECAAIFCSGLAVDLKELRVFSLTMDCQHFQPTTNSS